MKLTTKKPILFGYGLYAILSFVIFFLLAGREGSDISIHSVWASNASFADPFSFFGQVAHPMWHVLMHALGFFMPRVWAAAVLTTLTKMLALYIVHRFFVRYLPCKNTTGLWLAMLCLSVSAIGLPFYNPTIYYQVGSPNPWHSPTQLLVLVFMLFCVPYTAHLLADFRCDSPSWKRPLLLGTLLFFSLFAKPTFLLAFFPAACLYCAVLWAKNPKYSRFFVQILLCVLPALLLIFSQYIYYFGGVIVEGTSMVFSFSLDKVKQIVMAVCLMNAFSLYATLCYPKKQHKVLIHLTWLFFMVAFIEYLVLGESGPRAHDGNFGWCMMGASLMLWVVAFLQCFPVWWQAKKTKTKLRGKDWVAVTLLCWHALSGLYYIGYLLFSKRLL